MTTEPSQADRLAALAARRAQSPKGKRRRPAEASRILVAGAGTAAVLSMMAGMARADLRVSQNTVVEPAAVNELVGTATAVSSAGATPSVVAPATPAAPTTTAITPAPAPTIVVAPIKTVAVARPAQVAPTGRTSGSR